jgi:peptide/nickel transport system permease protein
MLTLFFDFARRFARNRAALVGLFLVLVVVGVAIAAPWWFPRNPLRIVGRPEIWPFMSSRYPLGTDSLGRDIAAMIAHGARTTLLIGLCASLTATIIGITVGATAAYVGGWVDELLMRLTELFQTIPNLIFVLTIVSILGQKIEYVTIAVGVVTWTPIARLTRAEFMSLRDREFVQACRAMGMGSLRIMFGEILPNALPPVIVLSSLVVAGRRSVRVRCGIPRARRSQCHQLGTADRGRPDAHSLVLVHLRGAGSRDHAHCAGAQPCGRWPQRCA